MTKGDSIAQHNKYNNSSDNDINYSSNNGDKNSSENDYSSDNYNSYNNDNSRYNETRQRNGKKLSRRFKKAVSRSSNSFETGAQRRKTLSVENNKLSNRYYTFLELEFYNVVPNVLVNR